MESNKEEDKIRKQKTDRLVARLVWIIIILVLGWAATTKNPHTFLTTAAVSTILGPALAYLLSPVDKSVLLNVVQAWRFALVFAIIVGFGVGGVYVYQTFFTKVIKIGVDLPMDGTTKDNPEAIKRGVELAVSEEGAIDGYKLEIDVHNHYHSESEYDVSKGKDNIEKMIQDPNVVGIIGPYHSTVALKEIPIINGDNSSKSRIALIGPSTTADCLTRPFVAHPNLDDYTKEYKWQCDNLNSNGAFFRMVAHNSKQGEIYANCLSYPADGPSDLCPSPDMHTHRNVAVLYDTSNPLYSVDIATAFAQNWKNKPGNKSAIRNVKLFSSKDDFRTELISKLREIKSELGVDPDLVFFAGEVESAKTLHTLMKSNDAPFPNMSKTAFAGASIMTEEYRDYLNDNKDIVSTAPIYDIAPLKNLDAPDNETQKGSRDFIRRYNEKYGVTPAPYSGAGYVAAKILIKAIRNAGDVPDFNDKTKVREFRENVIERIKNPSRAEIGITGEYRFEENGDFYKSAISIFKWNPGNPGNFNGWDYK